MEKKPDTILFYGTRWCPDCIRARAFFDRKDISYQWIDIDNDEEGRKYVERVNHGHRSVPTIVFTDGSILVEPSTKELENKMNSL
jgi:mycoredoxin